MAYTVTDEEILNEIQFHLLETANSGASWGSGLYTTDEMAFLLADRLQDLYQRTSIVTAVDVLQNTAANNPEADMPDDLIDIIRIGMAED